MGSIWKESGQTHVPATSSPGEIAYFNLRIGCKLSPQIILNDVEKRKRKYVTLHKIFKTKYT
jgi:hypothetical protein